MKITRNVISDLWPVYAANEASADTRALVDDFLSSDPEFARTLRAEVDLPAVAVTPSEEQERKAFTRTRDLVRGGRGLRGLRLAALVLTVFAFKRVIDDTAWVRPPTVFIVNATLATLLWTAYALLLRWYRERALRR
jgi:hypothetical protein